MKLYLDDFRIPLDSFSFMIQKIGEKATIYLESWKVVRSYEEFEKILLESKNEITHISLDHDLSPEHYDSMEHPIPYHLYDVPTGFEAAKLINKIYGAIKPIVYVHTMNPAGYENIINELSK